VAWWAGAALWGAALALASPWDLPLSLALADPLSRLGWLVALWGEKPAWAVLVLCLVLYLLGRRRPALARHNALYLALVAMAVLCPLLVTQALKLLWGRVRFHRLAAGYADFTPFYVPAGPGAGASFPSGHVAMSMVPTPLPIYLRGAGRPLVSLLVWVLQLTYGLVVAWGRVVYGRHYLTDVLFSFGFCLLAAPLVLRWARRRAQTGGHFLPS
jgi:membrane-associated phospholipid phosphatase